MDNRFLEENPRFYRINSRFEYEICLRRIIKKFGDLRSEEIDFLIDSNALTKKFGITHKDVYDDLLITASIMIEEAEDRKKKQSKYPAALSMNGKYGVAGSLPRYESFINYWIQQRQPLTLEHLKDLCITKHFDEMGLSAEDVAADIISRGGQVVMGASKTLSNPSKGSELSEMPVKMDSKSVIDEVESNEDHTLQDDTVEPIWHKTEQQVSILSTILSTYPDIWKEQKRFRAILMDYMPDDKLRRNLLYLSVSERIPDDLVAKPTVGNMEYQVAQKKLIGVCGCSTELASEIIDLWIEALGIGFYPAGKEK